MFCLHQDREVVIRLRNYKMVMAGLFHLTVHIERLIHYQIYNRATEEYDMAKVIDAVGW